MHPPPPPVHKPPPPSAYRSSLTSPAYLQQGQSIKSQSGNTTLIMQTNGNLELFQINADGSASGVWDTNSYGGTGSKFALQSNGGLVVYDNNNNTQWDSNTEGLGVGPYTLTVYDSYIQLSDKNNIHIWNSNVGILYQNIFTNAPSSITSPAYLFADAEQYLLSASKNTLLLMQYNGNLELFQLTANGPASGVWDTNSYGGTGSKFALQSNGGLVVYDNNNNTQWDSNTEGLGVGPYTLTVYDSYIQLSDKNNIHIWNSNVGILYQNIFTNAPSSITSPAYLFADAEQYLLSASKNTLLLMQYNGNLELFQLTGNGPASGVWDTNSYGGTGSKFALQRNGGLVVYDNNNDTQWDSNTEGLGVGPYTLTVYDSYIQLSDKNNIHIWNSNVGILYQNIFTNAPSSITSPAYLFADAEQYLLSASKNTLLLMQYNGNLELFQLTANGPASGVWDTNSYGGTGSKFALQSNGGLVVYDNNNNTQWDSNTEGLGVGPYTLTVYDSYIKLTDSTKAIIFTAP